MCNRTSSQIRSSINQAIQSLTSFTTCCIECSSWKRRPIQLAKFSSPDPKAPPVFESLVPRRPFRAPYVPDTTLFAQSASHYPWQETASWQPAALLQVPLRPIPFRGGSTSDWRRGRCSFACFPDVTMDGGILVSAALSGGRIRLSLFSEALRPLLGAALTNLLTEKS